MSAPSEQKWQWQVHGIRRTPESLRQIWKPMQGITGAARSTDGDKGSLSGENISI